MRISVSVSGRIRLQKRVGVEIGGSMRVIHLIVTLVLFVAFVATYYTNDILLKRNAHMYERLQKCYGDKP